MKKTKQWVLLLTEDQDRVLREHLKQRRNKLSWIRGAIALLYEKETGEEFPPDPIMGNPDYVKGKKD